MKFLRTAIGISIISIVGYFFYTMDVQNRTVSPTNATDKIEVVASFYPLYYFASEIGGEKARVTNLTPAGAEPHDYEPNTKDMVSLEKAKILIINGVGLEQWFAKMNEDLKKKNIRIVVAAEPLATQQDPHVWLDPVLAKEEVEQITLAFVNVDPKNQSFYENNRAQLIGKLEALNLSFQQDLRSCKQQNIITSHAAFGYIAARYGLKQIALSGLNPDEEPSPQTLVNVTKLARQYDINYIFFEILVSPRLAETIAKEVGAQTLVFNPLEGLTQKEQEQGQDYFSIQQENLNNLQLALECQ